jgi:hypothetical protein
MIKKIVISRDFIRGTLRIDSDFIQRGISSLKDLFSYQIEQATISNQNKQGLPVISIFDCLDAKKYFELNKIDIESIKNNKMQIWSYLSQNISVEAEKYLVEILQDSFVFGYHCPNIFVDCFIRNNIPFLDAFETAYRYMQDSFLGIRTNVNSVNNYVKDNQLSIHTMYAVANYLKAYYNNKKALNINENSCLLVGQTKADSVLINGDRFASLDNYKDEIIEISKNYNTIYYKQHPAEKLSPAVLSFLKSIPNAKEIFDNTYHILSNKNIKLVVGLNSGVLYEANFFGKQAQFLFNKVYNYTQDGVPENKNVFTIINSNSHLFKINFWASVLKDITETSFIDEKQDVSFENYQELFAHYLNISSSLELSIYKERIPDSFLSKLKLKNK